MWYEGYQDTVGVRVRVRVRVRVGRVMGIRMSLLTSVHTSSEHTET